MAHTTDDALTRRAAEERTRRIIREWHRQSTVLKKITYRGVSLGEATEWYSVENVLRAVIATTR